MLVNLQSEKIEGLTAEFTNLQSLNLSSVGLTSLDGLPNLNNLRSIDLSGFHELQHNLNVCSACSDNNELTSSCLGPLAEKCPRLYHIILCGSAIKASLDEELHPHLSLLKLTSTGKCM